MTSDLTTLIRDYASRLCDNLTAFMSSGANDVRAFAQMQEMLIEAAQTLRSSDMPIDFAAMVDVVIRHSHFGFRHIAARQSFVGWLAFRPGLDATLILGKWFDEPTLVGIWRGRADDPRAYEQNFWATALISRSLPHARQLQSVLARLNAQIIHPDPDTWLADRGVATGPVSEDSLVFDAREIVSRAHMAAFLHLQAIICSDLADAVGQLVAGDRSTGSDDVRMELRARARSLELSDPLVSKIVAELGLMNT